MSAKRLIDDQHNDWSDDYRREKYFRELYNRHLQENECEYTVGFPESGTASKSDYAAMRDSESFNRLKNHKLSSGDLEQTDLISYENVIKMTNAYDDMRNRYYEYKRRHEYIGVLEMLIHEQRNNVLSRIIGALELCATASVIAVMRQIRTLKNMKSMVCLFMLINGLTHQVLAQTRHFECLLEQKDDKDFCIFRNVRLQRNEDGVTFGFPGSTAPSNVAFEMCNMVTLPSSFWSTFAVNLQILDAESCGLRSITITDKMEVLHVRNNSIKTLTIQQNCNLIELDLSRNKLENSQSIAKCNKLKILNLNDNEDFASNGVLDLAMFKPHTNLEQLYLSSVGILYLENSKNIGLPLLHIIDLSRNRIIPADLSLEIFVPFTGLETLKLNNNAMGRLDYRQLRDIKALKTVYLNGNSFKCDYLVDMLAILQELKIDTPTDRFGSCQPNDRELDGMCCLPSGPSPTKPTPKPIVPTKPTEPPTLAPEPTPTPDTGIDTTPTTPEERSETIGITIGSVVAIGMTVIAVAVILIIRSKRQRQGVCLDQRELDKL